MVQQYRRTTGANPPPSEQDYTTPLQARCTTCQMQPSHYSSAPSRSYSHCRVNRVRRSETFSRTMRQTQTRWAAACPCVPARAPAPIASFSGRCVQAACNSGIPQQHHAACPSSLPQRHGAALRGRQILLHAASADAAPSPAPAPALPFDLPKVLSLAVIFLCSCFNYTLLQNMKDALIVTSAGAEVLPFLGSYGVLPGSILFYMYHAQITKSLPEKYVYHAAILPFLAFYTLFAFVLYPLAPMLHPTHLLESWQALLPGGLIGLAGMAVYWLFSIFFVIAELWGGVAISLLFWGLADDVCSMQEAKDVYPALGMIANVGLIVAGAWSKFVNKLAGSSDLAALRMQTVTIVVVSIVMLTVKSWVDKKYMVAAHADAEKEAAKARKAAKKLKKAGGKEAGALSTAFNVLKKSPKVGNLAVLVTAYFVVQKLFDFAWKAQLRLFYPSSVEYQGALADVAQMIGVATIAMMATSRFAFEYLGWRGTALITPVAIGISGTIFFAAALGAANPGLMGPQLAALIIPMGALAGVFGRVISKAAKYSLFDPAKEMVYITMERQEKTEGKAAVDLLASYFGKSGASILTQVLVLVFGTLNRSMPLIAASHLLVCAAWTRSTMSLATLMEEAEATHKSKEQAQQQQQPEAGAAHPTAAAPALALPSTAAGLSEQQQPQPSNGSSPSPAPVPVASTSTATSPQPSSAAVPASSNGAQTQASTSPSSPAGAMPASSGAAAAKPSGGGDGVTGSPAPSSPAASPVPPPKRVLVATSVGMVAAPVAVAADAVSGVDFVLPAGYVEGEKADKESLHSMTEDE